MLKSALTILLFWILLSGFTQAQLVIDQPRLSDIFIWNNQIIAQADWDEDFKYYTCNTKEKTLTPLVLGKDSVVIALAENKNKIFAIVKRSDTYFFLSFLQHSSTWHEEIIPSKLLSEENNTLLVNDKFSVLFSEEYLSIRQEECTWSSASIRSIYKRDLNLAILGYPKNILLENNSIFAGFDFGEWGGGLVKTEIDKHGELDTLSSKMILSGNIVGLGSIKTGGIWIATGLAHLSLQSTALYHYEDSLKQFLWPYNEGDKINLGVKTVINCLTLDQDDSPILVTGEFGIFAFKNNSPKSLYHGSLKNSYELENISYSSYPVGITMDSKNNIYIATRSTGVFLFETSPSGKYRISQLSFQQ